MPAPPRTDQAQQGQAERRGTTYTDKGEGALSGNLTRDPELRFTPAGKPVVVLRVAESARIKDDNTGEWKDGPSIFHDVTAWGKQAENISECLVKGDRIAAVGTWQQQEWTGTDNAPHSKMVLVARDVGPSLLFREVSVNRTQGRQGS